MRTRISIYMNCSKSNFVFSHERLLNVYSANFILNRISLLYILRELTFHGLFIRKIHFIVLHDNKNARAKGAFWAYFIFL